MWHLNISIHGGIQTCQHSGGPSEIPLHLPRDSPLLGPARIRWLPRSPTIGKYLFTDDGQLQKTVGFFLYSVPRTKLAIKRLCCACGAELPQARRDGPKEETNLMLTFIYCIDQSRASLRDLAHLHLNSWLPMR